MGYGNTARPRTQHTQEGGATGGEARLGQWITLEAAIEEGYEFSPFVVEGIGPRRVGTVYRCGYWGTVDTVVGVHVKIDRVFIDDEGTRAIRAASFQISEYNSDDTRIRRHCTGWHYDRRNEVLIGPPRLRQWEGLDIRTREV